MNRIYFYCMLFILPYLVFGCDYSQYGRDHTMCKYKENGCSAKILGRGISQKDINDILRSHNDYRSKVANGNQNGQPKAANMREMKWDSELSKIAQRWADQCKFSHDKIRRTAKYEWVGQNVAYTGYSIPGGVANFTSVVGMWYDEVTKPGFNPKYVASFQPTKGTGHYTQVVWALSDRVGCGYIYYKPTQSLYYSKIYVCDYAPGGNVISQPVYQTGNTASQCTNGVSRSYKGLCNS